MEPYVAFLWSSADGRQSALARALQAELPSRWRPQAARPGLAVYTTTDSAPIAALPGGGLLFGRLYPRPDQPDSDPAGPLSQLPDAPLAAALDLTGRTWGDYLAIWPGRGGPPAVYRDPSGAIPALTWAIDGVWLVASSLQGLPARLRPPRAALDWRRIASWLADPSAAEWRIALSGVEAPVPGTLAILAEGGRAQLVWRPGVLARRRIDDPDGAKLRAVIDHCVDHLARSQGAILAEVSGGLDSAIVATSLAATGHAGRVSAWLNYAAPRAEGDERRYAEAVVARLGAPLTVAPKPATPLRIDDLTAAAQEAWPPVGQVDPHRDRDAASRAAAAGASAIFSGQGGDAAFFQFPSPAVAADYLLDRGWPGLFDEVIPGLALWTRRSVWAVLAESNRARRERAPPPARRPLTAGWAGWTSEPHPWWLDAATLPPGKRLQIHGLANAQLHRLPTRRGSVAGLVYPLLAQPVVEQVLAYPTYVLTAGGRDRALARAAFADRLPAEVAGRRGKGDMSAVFGGVVAASLDDLRPFLLDGCLVSAGLLDRGQLDAALSVEHLIWRGGSSAILQAAAIESWVRYWQTQVPDAPHAPRPRREV